MDEVLTLFVGEGVRMVHQWFSPSPTKGLDEALTLLVGEGWGEGKICNNALFKLSEIGQ